MQKKKVYKSALAFFLTLGLSPFANTQEVKSQPLVITINTRDKAQTIQNIGTSACWYSEAIGKHWPDEKKNRIAELLFSKNLDAAGNPRGIGVSMFRFNIGGGTTEQGAAGGIRDVNRRVECFLNPDGTYDWTKQPGYQWFLRKAKSYGVEDLLAFSNTPPVQFTKNGLGFKTTKDSSVNLKPESYSSFAGFLADVTKHFNEEGLHFKYLSPVNEPQWDWTGTVGTAKQEGTPWTNSEIHHITQALDSALRSKKLKTQITGGEAAMLSFLYGEKTATSRQIQSFFSKDSPLSFARFSTVPRLLAGHSYFTDNNDSNLVNVRRTLADTAKKYKVDFWQSEYSMLGNGFKEGSTGNRSPMDCALFLAKVIHHGFAVANATAWHFWNAYEPGNAQQNTRYFLLALKPDSGFVNGSYTVTKNLWALGHYSLFVRPGMQRLHIGRSDALTDLEAAQKTMITAYADKEGRVVVVAINYANAAQELQLKLNGGKQVKSLRRYITTAAEEDNMRSSSLQSLDAVVLPARSITTFVVN